MDNSFVISFNKDIESQASGYMYTLHGLTTAQANFVLYMGDGCTYMKHGNIEKVVKHIKDWFNKDDHDCNNCFISINAFNPFMHCPKGEKADMKEFKNTKNLYSLDTLLLDIDAKGENLIGMEDQVVSYVINRMVNDEFPLPNAFSYSGSGGIHLYYAMVPVYPSARGAVRTLKIIMSHKIDRILDDYLQDTGMEYEVDFKTLDVQRNDRLPGTMNPKTGRMCEFFKTIVPPYTFQKLIDFEDINKVDWNRYEKAVKKSIFNKRPMPNINKYLKKDKKDKTDAFESLKEKRKTSSSGGYKAPFREVAASRVRNVLNLGISGHEYYRAR